MNTKRILITGAGGMLGSYLIREYSDCRCTTLGRSSDSDIRCDLSLAVPHFCESYDTVIHCASCPPADGGDHEGTPRLLKALEASPPKEFVLVGCTSVYGKKEGKNIDETETLRPMDAAGRAAARAEEAVRIRCAEWGATATIMRCAPMFGAGIHGFWEKLYRLVCSGRFIAVRDGAAEHSLILAYDVARIIRTLAPKGGTYNVADGRNRPVTDLTAAMSDNGGNSARPYCLPVKWYKIAARLARPFPIIAQGINSELLDLQQNPLTFSTDRLRSAIGFEPHDTIEVIARRDPDYPYEDS